MSPRNRVAHCTHGSSDKFYIAAIKELPSGRYEVYGKWGRRGARGQLMVKGSFNSLAEAEKLQASLFAEKVRSGYEDIESASYSGTMTTSDVAGLLEYDPNVIPANPTPIKVGLYKSREEAEEAEAKRTPVRTPVRGSYRVRCVNNLGLEHLFVVGAEYNAEAIGDDEMLKVTDMTGMKVEVFAERFEVVK